MFHLPQIVVTGRIKENDQGGELLCFNINLGPLTLIVIANVPDEDQEEAPVYVKFKINTKGRKDVHHRAA